MAFRDYILDRFWLKLFSFILATLIWFTIQSNVQVQAPFASHLFRSGESRDFSRIVRVDTLPSNRKPLKIDPSAVTITVSGSAAYLDRIRPSDLQPYVIVPVTPDNPAPYEIEVRNLPANVKRERVTPPRVTVSPAGPG
jgi:hypothetical protein